MAEYDWLHFAALLRSWDLQLSVHASTSLTNTDNVGLLPFRHPIISVVGKPIAVKKIEKPTLEDLQEVQNRYIDELMAIWDTYKNLYASNRTRELTLVE